MVELCDGAWLDDVVTWSVALKGTSFLPTVTALPTATTMAFFLMYWNYTRINLSTFEFFPSAACKIYVKQTDTSWKDIVGPIVARSVLQPRRPTLCLLSFATKQKTAFEEHCFCVIQFCKELKCKPTGCLQRDVCCWLQHFHSSMSQRA